MADPGVWVWGTQNIVTKTGVWDGHSQGRGPSCSSQAGCLQQKCFSPGSLSWGTAAQDLGSLPLPRRECTLLCLCLHMALEDGARGHVGTSARHFH